MKLSSSVRHTFAGKTVILTGAASGLGRSLCKGMLESGATVHAFDLSAEGLAKLEAEASSEGKLHVRQLDVRDLDAYESAVDEVLKISERIDFLFNNAGVTLLGEAYRIPFDQWKWLLDINLMGVINGIQAVYPKMIARKHGTIINTASIAGSTGYATAAAYTTSKAAVLELTRSLRAEAKLYGVRVAAACPGYVNSNIFQQDRIYGADREKMIRDLPVKMMTPDEAAELYLKGVASGKSTIIFPFSALFLWMLAKWTPTLTWRFHRQFMNTFKKKEAGSSQG